MRFLGVAACVWLLASAGHAWAESPVDVEVIEEEEEDFFADEKDTEEEEAPADEPPAKAGVRKNAKAAFDEIEANEKGVAIKRKKKQRASSGDVNENVNQQVVNVVVVGEKETKSVAGGAKSEAKADTETPPATPATPTPPAAATAATQSGAAANGCEWKKGTWKEWWERPGMGDGDVLISYTAGGYGGGVYQGLAFEGLFAEWGGLKLAVHFDGFGHRDHDRGRFNNRDWDFFIGRARSVVPISAEATQIDHAFLHKEDLSLTLHFGSKHGLDFSPSIGVTHFGYHLDPAGSAREVQGGSGFARVGLALSYVYKRFFVGVDGGWYPLELFRYTVAGDDDLQGQEIRDPYDPMRFTLGAHVGLSL